VAPPHPELRVYLLVKDLQRQFAAYLGTPTRARGYPPFAGEHSLIVEVAPALAIERVTDLALRAVPTVEPGILFVERQFGVLEVHGGDLADVERAGQAILAGLNADPADQLRPRILFADVIEDLTELIEAQRRAAWSEVARRMAHEIKNPLTPIRLSAERLAKNLLGGGRSENGKSARLNERQEELVRECTAMIGAEVATLQRMVDEFSNFARLPKAAMEIASLNEVVVNSLKLYDERLNGIQLTPRLEPQLPVVMIDREQIKRALVNLIDNAAEAMAEVAGDHRITVITREVPERRTLELIVADTGPGIPPEDRERIFEPYFSTRKRGTGLGLAIVSRIVAEHQGRIRVQENSPRGARFIIELPISEQSGVGQTLVCP